MGAYLWLQALLAGLVLCVLTWAAAERGRMHRVASHTRRLSIWRALIEALRHVPRSRIHLAVGAVGSWL